MGALIPNEYVQFVLAMILFLAILIGSYWFVYAPTRRRNRDSEDRR
ncbi:MAG: hypothetical protein H0V53_08000 [Rubrobacter sp.]|nr:hypothetical protein [Rubrobacter sp.]